MRHQPELLAHPDEPLDQTVLVPLDHVAVVHGELVVEVVVPFTDGDEGGDEVVAWSACRQMGIHLASGQGSLHRILTVAQDQQSVLCSHH
jgi:hypothetical protein